LAGGQRHVAPRDAGNGRSRRIGDPPGAGAPRSVPLMLQSLPNAQDQRRQWQRAPAGATRWRTLTSRLPDRSPVGKRPVCQAAARCHWAVWNARAPSPKRAALSI